jgi:hypothetical protein
VKPIRHKYNAVRVELHGRKYASKAEAAYAATLHARKAAGEILGWLEQAPLHIPGGVRYVLDFLVFTTSGEVQAVEVKGMETAAYKIKRALIAEHYPWMPVEVVKASAVKATRKRAAAREETRCD